MKKLLLRLDSKLYRNYELDVIIKLFKKYFSEVEILDIDKQRSIIKNLERDNTVISIDKFIKTDNTIDISRVYSETGMKYLYHNIKYPGDLQKLATKDVILYDHDIVYGFGYNSIKALLELQGFNVKEFFFVKLNEESVKNVEILDFADFIDSGLVVEDCDGNLKRVTYHSSNYILNTRASIPLTLCNKFGQELSELLYSLNLYRY